MEDWNFYWKLAGLIFGATGLWKVVEIMIKSRADRRLKTAETKNLDVQAEAQIVGNWIQWSQHLEQRVKELEAVADQNRELMELVKTQKQRITELEEKVKVLEKEKAELEKEIKALKS